ncbi:hypothetical protein M440DRAFT_1344579, partial [Trichoderma longibrachiatum ATCC 18648]
KKRTKTYNSRCSLVVTHPTTNLPVSGLSMGERTGPRALHYLWSYVLSHAAIQPIADAATEHLSCARTNFSLSFTRRIISVLPVSSFELCGLKSKWGDQTFPHD